MFDGSTGSAFSFQRETFTSGVAEAIPFARRQCEEAGEDPKEFPFDPAYDRYESAERNGILRCYTVRHHGSYAGHAIFFVFYGMHSKGIKAAVSDMFWLAPEYRRPGVAKRLLQFVERELALEGVVIMHTQAREDPPVAGRLLEHLGHKLISRTYSKTLNRTSDG